MKEATLIKIKYPLRDFDTAAIEDITSLKGHQFNTSKDQVWNSDLAGHTEAPQHGKHRPLLAIDLNF